MKRLFTILLACVLALPLCAQIVKTKKVAILEVVDREGTVGYGVKLQLRASLTSAITQTPGYEGYDRVDMSAIFGEHDFQRTGVVSDDQIKKLGEMSGCDYVLIAEAATLDANNLILVAKVVNVTTGKVEISADTMIAANANGIRKGGQELAGKLFIAEEPTPTTTSQSNGVVLTEELARIAAEKEAERAAAAKARAEEKARIAAEKEAKRLRWQAENDALLAQKEAERVAAEQEKARIAAEKEAERVAAAKARAEEKARIAAEKEATERAKIEERERIAAEKAAAREWRRAHPFRDQRVRFLVSGGVSWVDLELPFPTGDLIVGWQKSPHWLLGAGISFTPCGEYDYVKIDEDVCGVDGYYHYRHVLGDIRYDGCENYHLDNYCYGHNETWGGVFIGSQVIPFYFNARLYWFRSKFSPYFNAKLGSMFDLGDKKVGGVYLAPSFGIAIHNFSLSVEGQFMIQDITLIDASSGVVSPDGNFYGNVAFRAEWAF